MRFGEQPCGDVLTAKGYAMSTIARDDIVAALEDVQDAHVPVSLRGMGMLSDVRTDGDHVFVQVCLPCMACPAISYLTDQIRHRVLSIENVGSVDVEIAWHLSWERSAVDDKARSLMRASGLQI